MNNLGLYIEKIGQSKTPDEAFTSYCQIMKKYGYDRAVYSLVTDHPSLNLPRQHGLVTNYPEHWMKYYVENNYIDNDPVINQISKSQVPFYWSELEATYSINKEAKILMEQANESGVCDGIGFSLQSMPGEIIGVGLARTHSDKEQKKDYEFLSGAYLLTVFFHETYRSLLSTKDEIILKPSEKEILMWASEGKTDDEISMILGITRNTIRFYWKSIFDKLEAYGRIYAITKAIRLGLVQPKIVIPTKVGSI